MHYITIRILLVALVLVLSQPVTLQAAARLKYFIWEVCNE
jgi:hypothetical protein